MISKIKTAILVLLLSTAVHGLVYAQDRPGSDEENSIISAVSEMNAGHVQQARDMLSAVLAKNTENDAAWYYLAMTAMMENNLAEATAMMAMGIAASKT